MNLRPMPKTIFLASRQTLHHHTPPARHAASLTPPSFGNAQLSATHLVSKLLEKSTRLRLSPRLAPDPNKKQICWNFARNSSQAHNPLPDSTYIQDQEDIRSRLRAYHAEYCQKQQEQRRNAATAATAATSFVTSTAAGNRKTCLEKSATRDKPSQLPSAMCPPRNLAGLSQDDLSKIDLSKPEPQSTGLLVVDIGCTPDPQSQPNSAPLDPF
jgi:hypothetical protein